MISKSLSLSQQSNFKDMRAVMSIRHSRIVLQMIAKKVNNMFLLRAYVVMTSDPRYLHYQMKSDLFWACKLIFQKNVM